MTKTPALTALFGWPQHPICDRLSGHRRGAATAQTARPHGTRTIEVHMQERPYPRALGASSGKEIPALTPSQEWRFWNKVEKTSTCWIWRGATDRNGYGRCFINSQKWNAHRVSYTLCVGPIPPRMVIDHLCRVTGCVNPEHLEAVTNTENVRRGLERVASGGKPKRAAPPLKNERNETGYATKPRVCNRGHVLSPENVWVYAYEKSKVTICKQCQRLRESKKRSA